ncbi:hypothetical protein O6H91_03G009100 [Diphasiastrum complanatum]|uniref:Uncharacterized protein n=1 Tax=Diphasiastrum complanatum TaxID=34168 RepID=A0ACC2E3X3_DIPCM|nr:hypothetical protein O6H91_03G009100 [Diphasiastrum complanatum]
MRNYCIIHKMCSARELINNKKKYNSHSKGYPMQRSENGVLYTQGGRPMKGILLESAPQMHLQQRSHTIQGETFFLAAHVSHQCSENLFWILLQKSVFHELFRFSHG